MRVDLQKRLLVMVGVLLVVGLILSGCSNLIPGGALLATPEQPQAQTKVVESAPAANPLPAAPMAASGQPDQELLASLYEHTLPSVVNIQVSVKPEATGVLPPPFETPDQLPRGEGTGFVYDDEGHIVTNNHVVADADKIVVYFYNGMWADAEVVATDPQADLAVIKVTPPEGIELRPLPLAEPNSIKPGYWVVALGSPFGLENTMTLGIVSALSRGLPVGPAEGPARYTLPDVIQTDAAINPGNSGGPLLNLEGQVVGVNFAINSPVRANSGVGFAIPVSVVRRVVPALIEEGAYHYAYLGIAGRTVDADVAEQEDLPENLLGAFVAQVAPDGPADKGGVKAGDVIVAIDGMPVRQFEDLVSYLVTQAEPGQEVTLTVVRDGKKLDLDVKLGERPTQKTPEGEATAVTIDEAIAIAREAAINAGMLDTIDATSAKRDVKDGQPVWVVTLEGDGKTVTVVVDANTGDVLEMGSR